MTAAELVPDGGWIGPSSERLAPARGDGGWLWRALARPFRRKELPRVIALLRLHPRLFWGWLHFASRLMPYGRLDPTLREMIILRTAWNCRSRYEWGQHVEIGLSVGLTADALARIAAGPEACGDVEERLLLIACDEIFDSGCLTNGTFEAITARHDQRELIEIIFLVGHYQMLAGLLKTTGLALDAPIEKLLEDLPWPTPA